MLQIISNTNETATGPELVQNGSFSEIGADVVLNGGFSELGTDVITNGSFNGITNIVLDGDFPLPNVNWIIAATTTINGGSATFEGLGAVTEADILAAAFGVRVVADGGVVESESCLITDLTFLTDNP